MMYYIHSSSLFLFLWSSSAYKSVQLLLFISLSSMKHVCIRFNGQMTNLRLYLSFCDLWLNKPRRRRFIQYVGYVCTLYCIYVAFIISSLFHKSITLLQGYFFTKDTQQNCNSHNDTCEVGSEEDYQLVAMVVRWRWWGSQNKL